MNDFYCNFVLNQKITVNTIKETDKVLAYHHTKPKWTFHVVIIPKEHIATLTDITDMSIIKEIFEAIQEIVIANHLDRINYKIITNGGEFQDSKHVHFHLVSGKLV